MEYGWEWIWSVAASSAGAAALVALAGYLGRTQISHWLNKDLEAIKAQHQRDLESYKVSLIAEAERAKATQEVKKASALLLAEKEFEALNELHLATLGNAKEILSRWLDKTRFSAPNEFLQMRSRCARLEVASDACSIFLPDHQDRGKILVYRIRLEKLLKECENPDRVIEGDEADDVQQALLNSETAVDLVLNRSLMRLASLE